MQLIPVTLLGAALLMGLPAFGDVPASAALQPTFEKPVEKKLSREEIGRQLENLLWKVYRIMESVKDRESADKAATQLKIGQKEFDKLFHLAKALSKADQKKLEDEMDASEYSKKMGTRGEGELKHQKRIEEAGYYGSAALRAVMKNEKPPSEENASGVSASTEI